MFGTRLKELRTAYDLNQVQLAKELGVSKQSISNWENDNILPSIDMLIRIAKRFSVSCDYLLELDDRNYGNTWHNPFTACSYSKDYR